MSIEAVGSDGPEPTPAMQAAFKQMRTDFKALSNAMKNNDLAGAQKAYAAIQQDQGNMPNKPNNTTLTTDIANLGSALQSGDMAKAQQAFATLQQDGKSLHHGHHHHGGGGTASPAPATATTGNNVNQVM